MIIRVFPATRTKMIRNLARHMVTLSDADAEAFLVWHFDLEWERLIGYGVAEEEAESYISSAARAVWLLLADIQKGVA